MTANLKLIEIFLFLIMSYLIIFVGFYRIKGLIYYIDTVSFSSFEWLID